jgi:hypothetical protein
MSESDNLSITLDEPASPSQSIVDILADLRLGDEPVEVVYECPGSRLDGSRHLIRPLNGATAEALAEALEGSGPQPRARRGVRARRRLAKAGAGKTRKIVDTLLVSSAMPGQDWATEDVMAAQVRPALAQVIDYVGWLSETAEIIVTEEIAAAEDDAGNC